MYKRQPYPQYLIHENSRILDPGQAGLAVSVGSIAAGTMVAHSPGTAIAFDSEPSPFTRTGPGIKGEAKPDLVEFGGNLVTLADSGLVQPNAATNVVMASHKLSPASAHNHGTSFAAPRVSHKIAVLLQELQELGFGKVSAPLLKAFLVNSAQYGVDLDDLQDRFGEVGSKQWLQVLGYGRPNSDRATECDEYSMLLFHQGKIESDKVAFFDVPIPANLTESTAGKRITVTLAHYPEVQKWGLESYFGTDLKWRMFRGDVDRGAVLEAMSKDDEVRKEANMETNSPTELGFEHKVTLRSRGAVQHDWIDWKTHKEEYSKNHYTLAIAASKRWARSQDPIPFAVVVRIEDLGGTIPIYAEIASEIDILIEQQSRV